MHNPTYLSRSRHGVYYFRWPMPRSIHPLGHASTIKVSLGTREPKAALNDARYLFGIAAQLVRQLGTSQMQFQEMRAELQGMFSKALRLRRQRIMASGRLLPLDIEALGNTKEIAAEAVRDGEFPSMVLDEEELVSIIAQRALPIERDSDAFRTFGIEYTRALRDYAEAILDFDASLERVDLRSDLVAATGDTPVPVLATQPLEEVVRLYMLERSKADRVAARSSKEWIDHFDLLYEIVGSISFPIGEFDSDQAQKVKNTLLVYPKNRRKKKATRELTLVEALKVDAEKIATATINKYLQTYISLFGWAKRNRYVEENFFDGMTIYRRKGKVRPTRDGFTTEQVEVIVEEALHRHRGLVRHEWQKWGLLIATFSGARLNEIAQLHLSDVRLADGVWCFDLNDLDDGTAGGEVKRIKSEAGRRLVPVHSRLLREGLLEYVDELKAAGQEKLFPSFTYDTNNGWGRKLGRWANNTLLVKLGYKTDAVVFHSFRHTVSTQLGQADVQEPIIKAIIGHAQEGVFQNHYFKAGYKISQLAEAIELLQPHHGSV